MHGNIHGLPPIPELMVNLVIHDHRFSAGLLRIMRRPHKTACLAQFSPCGIHTHCERSELLILLLIRACKNLPGASTEGNSGCPSTFSAPASVLHTAGSHLVLHIPCPLISLSKYCPGSICRGETFILAQILAQEAPVPLVPANTLLSMRFSRDLQNVS